MSRANTAEFLIPDDDPQDVEPDQPPSLTKSYLQSRQLPGAAIARRMLWLAAGPTLLRDIRIRRPRVILIETPDDWFDLIHEAARDLIRNADFVTCRSAKASKPSSIQEAGLLSATARSRSLVVIAAIGVGHISRSVLLSIDHRVVIQPPDRAILAGALRNVFGLRRTPSLPRGIMPISDATAVVAAIRPSENAGRAIARLAALSDPAQSSRATLPPGPCLEELGGYGAARDWGIQLAEDLKDYRAGKMDWSQLSSAAILHGLPGVGKTFFAAALARSCQVPLITTSLGKIFATTTGHLDTVIKGLDAVFSEARAVAPSILFIDELDSLPDRATLSDRGRDWWSSVCNYFLKLLDEGRNGIVILAATNLIDRIDQAILRPGRIDRHFRIELPTQAELVLILQLYLRGELSDEAIGNLARMAQGLTGAAVALAVKMARGDAKRENRGLELRDLIDRIVPDDRNTSELHRISAHEAGHALVAILLNRRVSYVSTVPGSGYGGISMIEMTRPIATRSDLEDQIAISLAGRNAERLVFGNVSSGAHSDLRLATWLAAAIHGSFAMGDSIVQLAPVDNSPSLIADPEFRSLVEAEMRHADERCAHLLATNVDALKRIIANLLEHRVLAEDQVLALASPS